MKKNLLLLILLTSSFYLMSQNRALSLYTFEESQGNFTSIADNGTLLTPDSWDDGCTPATAIGFNFEYNGVVYSQFSVNTNGTVNLGDQYIDEETNDLESADATNLLAPLWDDLKFYGSGSGDGIFYLLEGDAGNQVLTIEFLQVGRYNSSGFVDFQVKLYEFDNHIEFIYGDLSEAIDWHEYSTTSIGMNAQADGSTEFISLTPDFENGATISFDTENDVISPQELSAFPVGTTYAFTPPPDVTDVDVAVTGLVSPVSDFLSGDEIIEVEISNLGLEVTDGLTLTYEIIDVATGNPVGDAVTESFTDYPLASLNVTTFQFDATADLSSNSKYDITITATLDSDVDTENNQLIQRVNGVDLDERLFENGPIVTQTGVGANGDDVSVVQTNLNMWNYGYNTNTVIGYRNADEFVIPEGEEWIITGLGFYVWQTGSDTISTINHLDFRIYDGAPNLTETDTLYDFYDINKLSGSKFSGIYRVYDDDIQNNERPVMLSVATFDEENAISLTGGTYWVDFSAGGTMDNGPWTPFITKTDSLTTGNAWHLGFEGWVNWTEDGTGTQQGMPFMLYGYKGTGIQNHKNVEMKVYPNPAQELVNVKMNKPGRIEIRNICGAVVYNEQHKTAATIDVSGQKPGVYLISIVNNRQSHTRKLIIK